MAVFRVERNTGYTVMSNHHLRNKELSLKAKGLLSQMLSLPEDWDYTLAGLSYINRESIDAIRTAVWELEKAGYITRRQGRDEKGKMTAIEYTIYEQPQPPELDCPVLEKPTADNPILENPTTDNPTSENPTQLNKDISRTNLPKKEKSNTDLSITHSIPIHSLNPLPYDGDEAAEPPERKRTERNDAYRVYEEIIKDNIAYDILLQDRSLEEQKKAVRSGYDMDIIPSDLATFGSEAKNLLQDLQSRNERMFLLTFLVVNMADTKRKLDNDIFATAGFAQKNNCALTRLDYLQEAGFMSSIPLGENLIPIQRGLTTSSTAIFIPFITQELFQKGAALYYGLNALSNNMILCDRKQLKNPNGLILGTPGSGKSFAAKREMTNAFLITDDDIIICDPEAEYFSLVQRLGGQVIRLSPTGKGMDGMPQYVNPMDINLNYSEDDNPLALKSDFILSLCELVIGGKEGLQPVEKTVIDRAVRNVYRPFLADPDPAKMPILGDLYNELLKQPEPEAARIAAALELYVSGSLNVFNHRTNVELSNRLVCFDIKQLGKQLKKLGMLIVQDQVWNRVTVNRAEKKATRYYMDEFHLLLREEQTAAYSVEIWKRFRKWGGIPTAITQNVKDLLSSREVENIFENSDFVLMLNQAQGDRAILAKQLNISPQQMKYVTHTEAGEGLIFYGNVVLPFIDRFPTDTELYRLLTTKPNEKF